MCICVWYRYLMLHRLMQRPFSYILAVTDPLTLLDPDLSRTQIQIQVIKWLGRRGTLACGRGGGGGVPVTTRGHTL
jgi:hypothetical protein